MGLPAKLSLNGGVLFLLGAVLILMVFSYWIISSTEEEIARDFYYQNNRLILKGDFEEVNALREKTFLQLVDGPMDEVWLKLVLMQKEVTNKLSGYIRLLMKNPDRKASYEEISNILTTLNPEENRVHKKSFLLELNAVSNIRKDYLKTYKLLVE